MLNKVILIGYVGGEPEIRLTKGADPVCSFSVATHERLSDKREHTEWFSVVTFGKMALNCTKALSKGSLVYIEGRLRSETFEDKTGEAKTVAKLYPSTVNFLDAKKSLRKHPVSC